MNKELSDFAARLRQAIAAGFQREHFDDFAVELFALQYQYNAAYRSVCNSRNVDPSKISTLRTNTPSVGGRWRKIPHVPTDAFKHLELTSLSPGERTATFHSSGTTGQTPSRHFHSAESLDVYHTSLWEWFRVNLGGSGDLLFLTPNSQTAPHSSLIHMFETVRQKYSLPESVFAGSMAADNSWLINFPAVLDKLKSAVAEDRPITLLGTAFSFVHLLDHLIANNLRFELPEGSRVMETGGYKNRSRVLPKAELHTLITQFLGVPADNIICEYGMSELSSQAYTGRNGANPVSRRELTTATSAAAQYFYFPSWARVQIISPETNREVADGEKGLVRIFDLANVFSVAAIQTEDLGIRRGEGFELIGRAEQAEQRGCSLMN